MKFKELGRFTADQKLTNRLFGLDLRQIALIQDENSGDYGICEYYLGQPVSPRDATKLRLSSDDLLSLLKLINKTFRLMSNAD